MKLENAELKNIERIVAQTDLLIMIPFHGTFR